MCFLLVLQVLKYKVLYCNATSQIASNTSNNMSRVKYIPLTKNEVKLYEYWETEWDWENTSKFIEHIAYSTKYSIGELRVLVSECNSSVRKLPKGESEVGAKSERTWRLSLWGSNCSNDRKPYLCNYDTRKIFVRSTVIYSYSYCIENEVCYNS